MQPPATTQSQKIRKQKNTRKVVYKGGTAHDNQFNDIGPHPCPHLIHYMIFLASHCRQEIYIRPSDRSTIIDKI